MVTITEPGLYPDLTNADYHADPIPGGSLSASGAKALLRAPAKFRWEQKHPVHKDVFDFGSVAHAKALSDDTVTIVRVEANDWRTNAAKAIRDEAREAGHVALLAKDCDVVDEMVAALMAEPDAKELLTLPGKSEQSAFWQDKTTGVWRRARFDRLPDPIEGKPFVIVDYKSAASSEPEVFAKACADYGYFMQAPWYCDAVRALKIHPDPAFAFVVQEKDPPYLVTVCQLDVEAMQLGDRLNERALRLYAECSRTGVWPGYTQDVAHISLPRWFVSKQEENVA